ncbi:MAG: hypothetical protein AB1352_05345 [Patescibacteria group bacterium]
MNTYLATKKIHRLLVLVISLFILIMAGTGVLLKYSIFVANNLRFIDLGMIRYLHNQLSPWFALILFSMALTGLYMYFYPFMRRKKGQDTAVPPQDNNLA